MTNDSEFLSRIRGLAEPVAQREGCEIYDIEWVAGSQGRGRTLRVYIDKAGGVSLDDCSNVSRGLNLILDVDDAIPGSSYSLEVSSPGLERTLREPRHFSGAIGSQIHVRLRESKENLKAFKGRLAAFEASSSDPAGGATAGTIVVELDNGKQIRVTTDDIHKAKIMFVEPKNTPPGGGKKGPKIGQRKS